MQKMRNIDYLKNGFLRRIKIYSLIPQKLCNTIYYYISCKENNLVVNASVFQFLSRIKHFNLGDDLNVYMLKELVGKRIFVNNQFYHKSLPNLMCIGSVIDWLANEKTAIWGAGIIAPPLDERTVKQLANVKIYAVRGRCTRDILLQNGIKCPDIFGDPALLLPYIYNPKVEKVKNRIGIIPHFYDVKDKNVLQILNDNPNNTMLINIQGYKNWKDTIQQILSCEFIVSSSLHGLILSDAYGIPNIWVSFSNRLKGGDFKFRDYYSVVGKEEHVITITGKTDICQLFKNRDKYRRIQFDPKPLIKSCPMQIVHPAFKKLLE